jgi:hypothetical protein
MIQHSGIFHWVLILSIGLWGVAVVLMFLLWNLIYLALASGVVWALANIVALIFIMKPYWKFYRKTVSS